MEASELWLVRTQSNWIAGPYSKDQVVKMVQTGELGLQDEVCRSNSYWIHLHEREELKEQLGVEVPRAPRKHGEEVTETQTETQTGSQSNLSEERTDPELRVSAQSALTAAEDLPELSGDLTENTAILTNRRLRMLDPNPTQSQQPKAASSSAVSQAVSQTSSVAPPKPARASILPLGEKLAQLNAHVVAPAVERPSLFRNLSWLLVVLAALLAYAAVRLLKT